MNPPTRHFNLLFLFCLLLIGVGVLYAYKHPSELAKLQSAFLQNPKAETIFSSIGKEIVKSGKLFAASNAPDAYLTKTGTFSLTNMERKNIGLMSLTTDSKLDQIAFARAKDMFAKQYFEHVSPSGDSASRQAEIFGYEYISIGENIALGNFKDDQTLVTAWMNSPGHRANIVSTKFTELGIAVLQGEYEGKKTWIAVQIFGRPISDCPIADSTLKSRIEANEAVIARNQSGLSSRKAELEAMERDHGASEQEYRKKVNEYNDLVQETNALITVIKSDIAIYNTQVDAFNKCIGVNT